MTFANFLVVVVICLGAKRFTIMALVIGGRTDKKIRAHSITAWFGQWKVYSSRELHIYDYKTQINNGNIILLCLA